MSLWKKITGKSWAKHRGVAAAIGGITLGAVSGGILAPAGAALAGAALGASIGGSVGGIYTQGDAQRQQAKDAKASAKEAEAIANTGIVVDSPEAAASVDTAGNAAYRRKQQALAAGLASGRSGTRMTSNLGGGGRLG